MSSPERLTSKAVNALTLKHPNSSVYLQINVKQNPSTGSNPIGNKRVASPIFIPIPHRAREKKLSDMTICLIVKDPQQRYKKILEDDEKAPTHDLFTEIVSVSKLRSRITVSTSSKKLPLEIEKFDLIVAHTKVIHLLPDILPPKLYKNSKTIPVPIYIESKENDIIDPRMILYQIKKIVNKSTVLVIPKKGNTCFSVLIGTTNPDNMSKLIDNVNTAIDGMVDKIDAIGGYSNITSISIKTADSINLPVVNL